MLKKLEFKDVLIFLIAITGILTTVELTIVYFDANFNPYALPSFCAINSTMDCDGVAKTVFSQFLGIPLSLWGMFLYFFIIFLLFVNKLKEFKYLSILNAFKNPKSYIAALGYISFTISMILAATSIFIIKKICILCIFTYFLDLGIALLATDYKNNILTPFKISIQDLSDDLHERKYLIPFVIVISFAACILTYTTFSNCLTPQVKRVKDFKKYKKMTTNNPFKIFGNDLGDKDAKTVVYIYTDYRCPMCQTYNVILSRAAVELKDIKFIHKNYPLDKECNRIVKEDFHKDACMLARYSIAAEKQGRLWDMNNELFETQPDNEQAILELAETMGMDVNELKKDANSKETKDRLQDDIESAIKIEIGGTPSIVVNGKIYTGIKPYYELKDILIKAGAVEKQK